MKKIAVLGGKHFHERLDSILLNNNLHFIKTIGDVRGHIYSEIIYMNDWMKAYNNPYEIESEIKYRMK